MGLLRRQRSEIPTVIGDADRAAVLEWWQAAEDRLQSGRGDTSWLTGSIMIDMSLGYAANSGKRVPPNAYALLIRAGYALRMCVDHFATERPFDVSAIESTAVERLASLPRDPDVGTLTSDLSDWDEALMAPIVALASHAAESSSYFADIVSVEPAIWNACVCIATERFRTVFRDQGAIRRGRDLDVNTVESFLRYGFVLRALDEALGIQDVVADERWQ